MSVTKKEVRMNIKGSPGKAAFGRISWEEMLTQPKIAKKAAQFMKSLGLIDHSSPLHLTSNPYASGSEHHRLDSVGKGVEK